MIAGRKRVLDVLVWVGIGIVFLVVLFPPFMLFLTSIKTNVDALKYPPVWIFRPVASNYREIFRLIPFGHYLFNSLIVALVSTFIALSVGSLAAYGLARFRFKRSKDLSFWILSIRMTPPVAAAIPIFIIMRTLHLLDTYLALILAYCTFNIPFSVWLLRGFFQEIPREIEESAMVDGCSPFAAFWKISIPLIAPGIAATGIFTFIFSWNEFLFALILTGSRAQTVPVALTGFIRETGIMWSHMAAAGVLAMVPMVVFTALVQKNLVKGLTMGAIK
ncbi:carbohydrate ABC transporter permease [Thermatribacter velox]|jgi:ABC-type glycerol-3-phosphate transport system permease component|uniref:Carbohydrate ABC transporter permease n=1 Tax=Thermatribacter velox TaxID=3039681 RepID=A0ABZ2YF60_9BACT